MISQKKLSELKKGDYVFVADFEEQKIHDYEVVKVHGDINIYGVLLTNPNDKNPNSFFETTENLKDSTFFYTQYFSDRKQAEKTLKKFFTDRKKEIESKIEQAEETIKNLKKELEILAKKEENL